MKHRSRYRVGALSPACLLLLACSSGSPSSGGSPSDEPVVGVAAAGPDDRRAERLALVDEHLVGSGIVDARVLAAMRAVPRHRFVPADLARLAYRDRALPIGLEQTISQPYVVAFMTQAAEVAPGDKVLEIGTGSGYQAAVLAEIVGELWSIEIVAPLAERARGTLAACGYDRVHVRTGDGYRGWPEEAPFDVILVTAAPDHVPAPLLEQLAEGGRLVLPVGDEYQEIVRIRRTPDGLERERLLPVRFVPMTGEAQERR